MFTTISEIKTANQAAGGFYFSPDTMRFFNSRVLGGVYGGRFFITSEQFEDSRHNRGPRRFAIREASADGAVSSISPVLAYGNQRAAKEAIWSILYWLPLYGAGNCGYCLMEKAEIVPVAHCLKHAAANLHQLQ